MIRFSGIAPVVKKIHPLSFLCLIFPACWVTNFRCLPVSNPTLQKVSTLNSNAQTHKHTRKQIGWMDSCAKTTSNKNETNLIRQANIFPTLVISSHGKEVREEKEVEDVTVLEAFFFFFFIFHAPSQRNKLEGESYSRKNNIHKPKANRNGSPREAANVGCGKFSEI